MSILFPLIAPPLSSTVYTWPLIFNFVPNANFPDAAIVLPAVAFVPIAVLPVALPQHFAHGQYAVILYTCVPAVAAVVVAAAVAAALVVVPALDVTLFTCTILFTGSVITFSDNCVFSISTSFWYFILYVTSFSPFFPCCNTLFVVFVLVPAEFFVTVS